MGSNNTSNQPPEKSSEGVSGTPSPVLSQHDDTVYQICTCGQRGSGKTSLIRRWARGKWEPTSESTTDIDFIHSSLLIDGKQVGLQVVCKIILPVKQFSGTVQGTEMKFQEVTIKVHWP
eukprot:TRINITY_DN13685_c0_g3_i7.p1 TRINITY_DN13685_c0_g3~~TRINITY_DN13685_c0_g3_i7.p1  ORF type:complete len:119 (-),score=18.84 TRINITY_DN13685_c0_g3_i7:588-944(-)